VRAAAKFDSSKRKKKHCAHPKEKRSPRKERRKEGKKEGRKEGRYI
jgi:hypothetical protein